MSKRIWLYLFSFWGSLYAFDFSVLQNEQNRIPCPPYITGDAFRAHCDFVYDETTTKLQVGEISDRSVIFVGPYVLKEFFETYHPSIRGRYILVTHNTDFPAPAEFHPYLEDEKLIAWFAQNVEGVRHPKLIPIPIGLGNRYTFHGDLSLLRQNRMSFGESNRSIFLFLSFTSTNHRERREVIDLFARRSCCTKPRVPSSIYKYSEYLEKLTQSVFVLSPRGQGLDCHRTWEALYLGAIPIVKSSASDQMFQDLPVLIIKDWSEATDDFLREKQLQMAGKKYNLEKLDVAYWLRLIDQTKYSGRPPD